MTILSPDALLAHIISQTRGNLEFLVSQKQLSEEECRSLQDKLKSIEDISRITQQVQNVAIAPPPVSSPPLISPAPLAAASNPIVPKISTPKPTPTSPQVLVRVRALWDYNKNSQETKDLSFSAGDMIDVIRETNGDWWEGRCNGKTGLFPSNYVEQDAPVGFPAPSSAGGGPISPPINYQYPYYPPLSANPYMSPATTYPNSAPGAPAAGEEVRPGNHLHRNSSYTPAHPTTGGVAFGAGSVTGGGPVNSIF